MNVVVICLCWICCCKRVEK